MRWVTYFSSKPTKPIKKLKVAKVLQKYLASEDTGA